MTSPSDPVSRLEKHWDELRARLGSISEMRPGSLVERYRRCGKPSCHCARAGAQGHGPCWSLTWAEDGKTFTRVLPAGSAVEQVRHQLAEYKRFRRLVREFADVGRRLCDARLGVQRQAEAEKGGSSQQSKRRPPARSRPS